MSLKRLLAEAATGAQPRLGMTKVEGYLTEGDDVILWGRVDQDYPELLFDDLVIAIRSVRGNYGRQSAGVSFDSKQEEGMSRAQSEARANERLRHSVKWRFIDKRHAVGDFSVHDAICKEIANFTRVDGLPRDCQLSKTLLDADYQMKRVGLGVARLAIRNPFKGELEADVDAYNAYPGPGRPPDRNRSGRMWFEPGRTSYLRDENSVFLDCVQVVLRDVTHSGEVDNIYRKVTCEWTNRMDEINRSELIWKQMYAIFRHFALAQVMSENSVMSALPAPAKLLLWKDYPIPFVSIPTQYPPIIAVFTLSEPKLVYTQHKCGGISLAGLPVITPITEAKRTDLHLAGRMAVESMRSCTESCWNVE